MAEVIIATDIVFTRIAERGWIERHNTPIFVLAQRPGRLLFNDGTILKSEGMAQAEEAFNNG